MKRQIPLHGAVNLPEIGPYHWEGPLNGDQADSDCRDQFIIRGEIKDPAWIERLRERGTLEGDFKQGNVTELGGSYTTGYGMYYYSDGTFKIVQCRYFGDEY
ncbi:MAG: hypothetical protein R3C11_22570 [Planctomycetaceae bacterium]